VHKLSFLRDKSQRAFLAGFLAWTFDAFNFFILTYVLARVANDFRRPISEVALTLTACLVMRPVGAAIFGVLGDRYGRRRPLMASVMFYAIVEALSGLAPNYHSLLLLQILFGIGMGGVWGLGASLAMESVPPEKRGFFSGLYQNGYSIGSLLAAIAFLAVFPRWGWRPMFFLSIVPAVVTVLLLLGLDERGSAVSAHRSNEGMADYFRAIARNGKRALYLALLMSVMGFLTHGSQDLYPTFLQQQLHFNAKITAIIAMISMIGAIVGGAIGGFASDRLGRRRTMVIAELCALMLIPLWAFSREITLLTAGAFLMQCMVQAAWGVIPAHINELVPGTVRALLPGFAYQIGICVASVAPIGEALVARRLGYGQTLGATLGIVVIVGILVTSAGPEARQAVLK
jgi:SHS family lactate transporter-like MFS transporter